MGGVVLDLLPQPPHVDGHGAGVERRRVSPDAIHELVAREHLSRVAGEEPEQVELLRGQLQLTAALADLARPLVDGEVVDGELLAAGRMGPGAAQHRAHARDELARRERLRDVVVRPELQPHDAVGLLAAGCQHDHGELRAPPDPAAELEPVRAGKHEVEDDERRARAFQELAGAVSVGGLERAVALPLEVAAHDLADDRLVVDDENGGHVRIQAHRSLRKREIGGLAAVHELVRRA